jgi:alkylhydroperoxidase family enzyme
MMHKGLERLVIGLLEAMCRTLWGFAPRMMPPVVRRMGAVGALCWFAANMPRYLLTMHVLGPVRTQLAAMAISLRNDCAYCALGHAYALQLIYFRDYGRPFPVDARTLSGWLDLPPHELGSRLRRTLQEAGLHAETLWVDRTLALAAGDQRPVEGHEVRIAHLVHMIGRMNGIAVEAGVEPVEARNPITENSALKARLAGA